MPITKKTIQDMLVKFRKYRDERRKAYENLYLLSLRKTNYEDNVKLMKPFHELTILNAQVELLELILKNNE